MQLRDKTSLALALITVGSFISLPAHAQNIITFEDLPNIGIDGLAPIPDGYQGFTWNNFFYRQGAYNPPSGYLSGTISGINIAFNGGGLPASFSDASSVFTLNSAYLTAAWYDDLNITITGLDNKVTLFSQTLTLSATDPTLVNFNWSGINEVDWNSFGGTKHSSYINGDGEHFALDDLKVTTVPESSTFISLGGMFLGLLCLSRRKKQSV